MKNNSFFKPTPLYKEFMILDLIEKNKDITQREMSNALGVAVSMINMYLDEYEQKGYIKREYHSTKTVEYFVTKLGIDRRKLLNIKYLKDSQIIYLSAEENINLFIDQIVDKGYKRILLYGAGEVAEILLRSLVTEKESKIEVLAVIDDDINKQNQFLVNYEIIPLGFIGKYDYDGILISSYSNNDHILKKLNQMNFDQDKIIQFFD